MKKVKLGMLCSYAEIVIDGEKYTTIMGNGDYNYQVLAIPSRLVKVIDVDSEVEIPEDE